MKTATQPQLSITIPVYNEQAGIAAFHAKLTKVLEKIKTTYEIVYCDDGSRDGTGKTIQDLAKNDSHIKLVSLSRNFGKESALSAAIHAAQGNAIIMLDGDGQHPVELIPEFLAAWKAGAKVVIGVRSDIDSERLGKRFESWIFHSIFNRMTGQHLKPGSDYRLIDRTVQQAFLRLPETDRITRGLIDWLGFSRTYIPITRLARGAGLPTYSFRKLIQLAMNSFVSLSAVPLHIFGILGVFITLGAFLLGGTVFVEQVLLRDPLGWRFTGTAMLGILILFLIGIVLVSQGIMSLYLSHTHTQTKGRPLYVIDYDASIGIKETSDRA